MDSSDVLTSFDSYTRDLHQSLGWNDDNTMTYAYPKLPVPIPHPKCTTLDPKKQYPKITNYVGTLKIAVHVELKRLSGWFPNVGKGPRFPLNISKNDNGTNLTSTTGSIVTPGCETYNGARYLAHLIRLMIESVEQPILVKDRATGETQIFLRNLQGLTEFLDFRIVNIVSNGKLTKGYISLAAMEADDDRLDWNPNYFPGLEHVLTRNDVDFKESEEASMTIFDSGKGVGMGVTCTEDCYLAYQFVVAKALLYPDKRCVMPRNSTTRFHYRQAQKRLYSISNRQCVLGSTQSRLRLKSSTNNGGRTGNATSTTQPRRRRKRSTTTTPMLDRKGNPKRRRVTPTTATTTPIVKKTTTATTTAVATVKSPPKTKKRSATTASYVGNSEKSIQYDQEELDRDFEELLKDCEF